ncbi:MAG: hypothetical protein H6R26_1105, partial [Proteobacteria bacterium]|nr:hypothetical protein [Pseudomonadota bacterium]
MSSGTTCSRVAHCLKGPESLTNAQQEVVQESDRSATPPLWVRGFGIDHLLVLAGWREPV